MRDRRVDINFIENARVLEDRYLAIFAPANQLVAAVFVDVEQDDREHIVARDVPVGL